MDDAALPALSRALDPERMLPVLSEASGLRRARDLACSVEVLKHWPGKRCTLRYTLARDGQSEAVMRLVGKLYGRPRLAKRVYLLTEIVSNLFEDAAELGTPAPLSLVPDLGLFVRGIIYESDQRAHDR